MDEDDKALATFREAVAKDENDHQAHFFLGVILTDLKKFPEAVEHFKKAIALNPESDRYHFNLGAAYEKMGEYERCIEAMEKAIKLNPDYANAYNYIGYIWADQGLNLEESVQKIKKALSYEPENGYFLDSLGWAYFKQGRFKEALVEMEKATTVVKDDPVILDHLGDIYRSLNRLEDAAEAYRMSISIEENPKVQKKLKEIANKPRQAGGP
jgi:tetratricopeptide (TPR) repeat protein